MRLITKVLFQKLSQVKKGFCCFSELLLHRHGLWEYTPQCTTLWWKVFDLGFFHTSFCRRGIEKLFDVVMQFQRSVYEKSRKNIKIHPKYPLHNPSIDYVTICFQWGYGGLLGPIKEVTVLFTEPLCDMTASSDSIPTGMKC